MSNSTDTAERLELQCPGCQRLLHVPATLAGRQIACPGCKQPIIVSGLQNERQAPTASTAERMTVQCGCAAKLSVPLSKLPAMISCPKCQRSLNIAKPGTKRDPAANPLSASPHPKAAARPANAAGPKIVATAKAGSRPAPGSKPAAARGSARPASQPRQAKANTSSAAFTNSSGIDFNSPDLFPSSFANVSGSPGANPYAAASPAMGNPYASSLPAPGWTQTRSTRRGIDWSGLWKSKLVRALGIAFFISFAGMIGGVNQMRLWADLEARGVTVAGVIDEAEMRSRKGVKSFSVDVTYFHNAQKYQNDFSVNRSFFESHVNMDREFIINDSCSILCDPSDPNRAIVHGGSNNNSWMAYVGLLGFAVSGIGLAVVLIIQLRN